MRRCRLLGRIRDRAGESCAEREQLARRRSRTRIVRRDTRSLFLICVMRPTSISHAASDCHSHAHRRLVDADAARRARMAAAQRSCACARRERCGESHSHWEDLPASTTCFDRVSTGSSSTASLAPSITNLVAARHLAARDPPRSPRQRRRRRHRWPPSRSMDVLRSSPLSRYARSRGLSQATRRATSCAEVAAAGSRRVSVGRPRRRWRDRSMSAPIFTRRHTAALAVNSRTLLKMSGSDSSVSWCPGARRLRRAGLLELVHRSSGARCRVRQTRCPPARDQPSSDRWEGVRG